MPTDELYEIGASEDGFGPTRNLLTKEDNDALESIRYLWDEEKLPKVNDDDDPLESIRFLWDEEEKPEPALPINAYTLEDFRFVMGEKRGALVQLHHFTGGRIGRESTKDQILTALKQFHVEKERSKRQGALNNVKHFTTKWIFDNRCKPRKKGRVTYMESFLASIETELWKGNFSGGLEDAKNWDITGGTRKKDVFAALQGVDQTWGVIDELGEGCDPDKAIQDFNEGIEKGSATYFKVASGVKKIESPQGTTVFKKLSSVLEPVAENLSFKDLASVAGAYMDVLEFIEGLGINHLLTAHTAFKDFKKTDKRIALLMKHQSSRDAGIQEFCCYGKNKLMSRQYSNIYLGISYFARGIGRIITLLSAGVTAIVTEAMNYAGLILTGIHEIMRNAKGVYKFLLNTKGKARKSRASLLIWKAANTDEGFDLFQKFIKIELIKESMLNPVSKIQSVMWDQFFAKKDAKEIFQLALKKSLSVTPSGKTMFEAAEIAKSKAKGKAFEAAAKTVGETAAAWYFLSTFHTIIFGALGSRPKYAQFSKLEDLQEDLIGKGLSVMGTL